MVVLGRVDMVHRGKLSLWRFSFSFFPEDFQQGSFFRFQFQVIVNLSWNVVLNNHSYKR